MVQLLLDGGADVNAGLDNSSKKTAFILAAGEGHLDVMRLLIDRGANIKAELTCYVKSTLTCPSKSGHVRSVRFLLEESVIMLRFIRRTKVFWSLQLAIGNGHCDVVKIS